MQCLKTHINHEVPHMFGEWAIILYQAGGPRVGVVMEEKRSNDWASG